METLKVWLEVVSNVSFSNSPPKNTSHSWDSPKGPWQRLHLDFAGPDKGFSYLVIVDAYSKWPEVFIMRTTTSNEVIRILRVLFARYGFPYRLVTDNGPQFVSAEFGKFLHSYGIGHSRTAPYHPSTNGEAERFVQTLKNFLHIASPNSCELESSLQGFLLTYRTTPHSVTNISPSELLYGRVIRNTLEIVRPVIEENVPGVMPTESVRSFGVGDEVMIRHHTGFVKWIRGVVVQVLGRLHYLVEAKNKIFKCHVDQVRSFRDSNSGRLLDPYELSDLVNLGEASSAVGGGLHGTGTASATGSSSFTPISNSDSNSIGRSFIPRPVRKTRGVPPSRLNL